MQRISLSRIAAVLALAALAACDAPTSPAAERPRDEPARRVLASTTVTVTDSGGYPLITWAAVPGATSYTVRQVTMLVFPSGATQRLRTDLTTTTGTSYLDTSHVYTGDTSCPRSEPYIGPYTERYQYVIVSQLASGTSMQIVDAPIGECY